MSAFLRTTRGPEARWHGRPAGRVGRTSGWRPLATTRRHRRMVTWGDIQSLNDSLTTALMRHMAGQGRGRRSPSSRTICTRPMTRSPTSQRLAARRKHGLFSSMAVRDFLSGSANCRRRQSLRENRFYSPNWNKRLNNISTEKRDELNTGERHKCRPIEAVSTIPEELSLLGLVLNRAVEVPLPTAMGTAWQ